MKLGLANIITVYAVYRYRPGEVLLVVLVRIVLGAFSGKYDGAGLQPGRGALCLAGVIPLHKIVVRKDVWMLSVWGGAP